MGKRELLLIVAFVILGGIVYQITAPPPVPGEVGFSVSRIVNNLRREMRGNRASAERTATGVHAIDASVTEVRVTLRNGPLTITGEDRSDVSAELLVNSTGYDDAEAQRLAGETNLTFDQAGAILFVSVHFPEAGSQRVRSMALKVPSRLIVRMIERSTGKLDIINVAGVDGTSRGDTTIRQISGLATVSHRGGDLAISDAGSVKLSSRGSDVTLADIRGAATINTQAGELKTTGIAGPIELESNATDVTMEGLERTTEMVRVNATGGSIEMRGLRTESRIDLRSVDLQLVMDRPAIVSVYGEGSEPVEVTLPPGGFRVDAVAREGIRTTPDDLAVRLGLSITRATPEGEAKISGDVNGGGPLMTLRTRGPITFAAPADANAKPASTAKS